MDGFFEKKLEFFKIAEGDIFQVECVLKGKTLIKCLFPSIVRFFWLKVRKFPKLEKLENRMKKEYFEEKNAFIF